MGMFLGCWDGGSVRNGIEFCVGGVAWEGVTLAFSYVEGNERCEFGNTKPSHRSSSTAR